MRRCLVIPLLVLAGCSFFTTGRAKTPESGCRSISAPAVDTALAVSLAMTASILAAPNDLCEACPESRMALGGAAAAGAAALAFAASAAHGYEAPSSCDF